MLTVYLREFILTGKFGPIELGSTIENAISVIGKPEDITDFNNGHCEMIYAWYEFFYLKNSGIIYGIQNDHLATFPNTKTGRVNNKRDIFFKNEKFNMDIWFLKKNRYLTFEEVIKNLNKEKLEYQITEEFEGEKCIKFPSGVSLDFDDNSGQCYYHKESGKWTYSEKITEINQRILCGVRLFNLKLVE